MAVISNMFHNSIPVERSASRYMRDKDKYTELF